MSEARKKKAKADLSRALKQVKELREEWIKEIGTRPSVADTRLALRAQRDRHFMVSRGRALLASIRREKANEERTINQTERVVTSALADLAKAYGLKGQAVAGVAGGTGLVAAILTKTASLVGIGDSPTKMLEDTRKGMKAYYATRTIKVMAHAYRRYLKDTGKR